MADFAAYKESDDSEPLVINLDHVDLILPEDEADNEKSYIVFAKFPASKIRESGLKAPWYRQESTQLMSWTFVAKGNVSAKQKRDYILRQLMDGKRSFNLMS